MVESIDTAKRGPCDYSFELINIDGAVYRVPIQDTKNVGKILESNGERSFNQTGRKQQPRENR